MKTVLITGASRGIGLEHARRFAAKGAHVFAAVRTPTEAKELQALAASKNVRVEIRMIVGVPPGGSSDVLARTISQQLVNQLGQQVVVENRPGSGGALAMEEVSRAAPDGYRKLARDVTAKRVALAGARLANLLNDALK